MNSAAIGGYLELELPCLDSELHRGALRFQSARAALHALLATGRPSALWLPHFICDSVREAALSAGIAIKPYALASDFGIPDLTLAESEWLFYVDYFGLNRHHVLDVLRRYPRERVVIDNAQAFFANPIDCAGTLYSARKFVGVPDGGYLNTLLPVPLPEEIDSASQHRFAHLLARIDGGAEAGYIAYTQAEATFANEPPRRMSSLTQRLLGAIDYDSVRTRRIANFMQLHARLAEHNALSFDPEAMTVPLCYPFLGAPAGTRERLAATRIYTPAYWPELASASGMPAFEARLAREALYLPCNQHLGTAQIDFICEQVIHP